MKKLNIEVRFNEEDQVFETDIVGENISSKEEAIQLFSALETSAFKFHGESKAIIQALADGKISYTNVCLKTIKNYIENSKDSDWRVIG